MGVRAVAKKVDAGTEKVRARVERFIGEDEVSEGVQRLNPGLHKLRRMRAAERAVKRRSV